MNHQDTNSYSFSFESAKTPQTIFETLIDVRQWWVGLFGEDIKGNSDKLHEEFTFSAGNGLHYTKQRLVELIPNKKIVWQITESKLTFVEVTDEWTNTKIGFEISTVGNSSQVTFTHEGLVKKFQCYTNCSDAWTQYLKNLAEKLK
jgi:Activator of Hsp90 ATPase homolog 1-like protein